MSNLLKNYLMYVSMYVVCKILFFLQVSLEVAIVSDYKVDIGLFNR